MTYEVVLGDRSFEVAVEGETIRLGGRTFTGQLVTIPHTLLRRLVLNGVSRTYAMVRGAEGWEIQWAGRTWAATVADERARSLRRWLGREHRRPGAAVVRAPMPGLVLRVEVAEGDQVGLGAGLVVLEAMKMENEITAPAAGVVRRILVRAGEAVERGAGLLEIGEP